MEDTGIREQVIQEICALARKYDVDRVILFGSRARGDFRRTSDIDLAVEGGDFVRFALDVDEETSTLLKFDIVDLGRNIQEELLNPSEEKGVYCMKKNENIALDIVKRAKEDFFDMFCALREEVERNWL